MTDKLRRVIREMLVKEIEELDETSTTAGAGPYDTPGCFRGNTSAGKKKQRKNSEQAGYTLVPGHDEAADTLKEAKSRYQTFKEDPSATPKKKIGVALSEAVRAINELDRVLTMASRLKTETNTPQTGLWKRTAGHLMKLETKMVQMVRKIQELKS
jgi:hypothetical protein